MKISSSNFLKVLLQVANKFDADSEQIRNACLAFAKQHTFKPKELATYHDALLFMIAHPNNEKHLRSCEQELQRIARLLRDSKETTKSALENSGLPHTTIVTKFSHDLLYWLVQQKEYQLQFTYHTKNNELLSQILRQTLPSAERELCNVGYTNQELLDVLHIKSEQEAAFFAEQFHTLEHNVQSKDFLFDLLEPELAVSSKQSAFSRSYNRFLKSPYFFHQEILKRFDHQALLNTAVPPATVFSADEKKQLIKSIKDSLTLMARETDPATYLDENALFYYQLERGIAIAIYGMRPNRQMSFESYVGYTLFKNGFPAAYGGSWVFGQRALFGMNIFESFRGGESGYMMCQLLRVYRQAFGIRAVEVEPYQFGKDNPDGIASGAFWFYYRYGFRPLDKKLNILAAAEHKKISTQKGYFSSYKTLEKFTESYISLDFEPCKQITVPEWAELITSYIAKKHTGNRTKAMQTALKDFQMPGATDNAIQDYALLAAALGITEGGRLAVLQKAARTKSKSLFEYQQTLLEFFA